MSAPGFYDDRDASKQVIDQHQALMWEVGDLMAQWEALQEHAAERRIRIVSLALPPLRKAQYTYSICNRVGPDFDHDPVEISRLGG